MSKKYRIVEDTHSRYEYLRYHIEVFRFGRWWQSGWDDLLEICEKKIEQRLSPKPNGTRYKVIKEYQ